MSRNYESSVSSKPTDFREIPVLDISPLIDGSSPAAVVTQLRAACQETGFFYVQNHGIPAGLEKSMFQAAKDFFSLSWESKQRLHIAGSGLTFRGYIPPHAENSDPGNTLDFKEAFDFGVDGDEDLPFFGANIMPQEIPGFRETCDAYHHAMRQLSERLAYALAMSLDLQDDYFSHLQRNPITIQRMLRCPALPEPLDGTELGTGAHTDFGFLTILCQDDVGGLEVQNGIGRWINVPPMDGTLIVGVGDLLQTMTNGRYRSTTHRVVNTSDRPRYSLPFYLDLDFHAVAEPVPTCLDEDTPEESELLTCGQYKFSRYQDVQRHLSVGASKPITVP